MVFGRKRSSEEGLAEEPPSFAKKPLLLLFGPHEIVNDERVLCSIQPRVAPLQVETADAVTENLERLRNVSVVLSICQRPEELDTLLDQLILVREQRHDGTPCLVITTHLNALTELGLWLHRRAVADRLSGIRLIVTDNPLDIGSQLDGKLEPVLETNVIKMPESPEVETTTYKYFYTISPSLRGVVRFTRELAENNVTRIYLLGGPGTGKTSLAYYYYLCRGKGNFVAVNLTAESTGDKASMKSLLCGHVPGAVAGAGSREGALSFARDGVCFLDESHGVTGVVMQVLMEVLDSGQFLPFGATSKRAVECAVIFASNRSWETLRGMIHIDEHARLGATMMALKDLAVREEDLIAVLSTTLAKFKNQCTSWHPPAGLTAEAWQEIRLCPWRGNLRTLIRVIETACVSFCAEHSQETLIDKRHIEEGIKQWEPKEQKDAEIYTSYR